MGHVEPWDDTPSPGLAVGQAVAIAGLALFVVLAVLSGLDRMQLFYEGVPQITGWPLAQGALVRKASEQIDANRAADAVALTRDLIRHDPVETDALGLYGFALQRAHQADAARDAYTVAAQLGWRNTQTQVYWLYTALEMGNAGRAAQHLDALQRHFERHPLRDKWISDLLSYDEGRTALAIRLRENPEWGGRFISELDDQLAADPDELAARAVVVMRTGRGHFDCKQGAPLVNDLLNNQLFEEAVGAHATMCNSRPGLLNDGQFDQLDLAMRGSELDWNATRRGDTEIATNPLPGGHQSFTMSISGPSTLPMLRQTVVVKPGAYRVTWHMPAIPPTDAVALSLAFDCTWSLSGARPGIAHGGDLYTADFFVSDKCPAPTLRFWLSPNHLVTISDVRLDPIAADAVDAKTLPAYSE